MHLRARTCPVRSRMAQVEDSDLGGTSPSNPDWVPPDVPRSLRFFQFPLSLPSSASDGGHHRLFKALHVPLTLSSLPRFSKLRLFKSTVLLVVGLFSAETPAFHPPVPEARCCLS